MKCELTYPERKDDWRPFRVVVHDCALEHLMSDAQQALRVYELMCITRPGDVCKYLWVELLEVPGIVRGRAEEQRKEISHPPEKVWPENFVPLVEFDRYFYWAWEDTGADDACWLTHRESRSFEKAVRNWYEKVTKVQQQLRSSTDLLIRFELESMAAKSHPFDIEPETPLKRTRPDYLSPTVSKRTTEYYDKVRELLSRPDLQSLTMSGGDVDFQLLRLVCTVQRGRALATGKHPFEVFPVCMTALDEAWDRGWGASITEYHEGVGYGDLWILNDDDSDGLMDGLVEKWRFHHKWILSHNGTAIIADYQTTRGDGWVLHEDAVDERLFRTRGKESLERSFRRMMERESAHEEMD